MSPILVVEISYDLGLRVETGTERPLLLYIIYKCTVQYSTWLIEVVNTYGMIWAKDRNEDREDHGVPAWRLMEVWSITVGFSPTLYC